MEWYGVVWSGGCCGKGCRASGLTQTGVDTDLGPGLEYRG